MKGTFPIDNRTPWARSATLKCPPACICWPSSAPTSRLPSWPAMKITLEAYPDLKANQNFLQLQEEIADVENKLAAVRRYFNSATKEYNNAVQTFPSNIVAGMTGFQREIMFDLGKNERANLDQAPKISF